MQTYNLPYDWQISISDNWQGEYEAEVGQYVFYPDDSDLTIRITPFHAEKDGVLAPAEVMENAYTRTIPPAAVLRNESLDSANGYNVRIYENKLTENGQIVYVIYIGCYTFGELLSVNIFGTDKKECEQVLCTLKIVKK